MNATTNPWEIAHIELKDYYTKDQIDEMTLCEIEEILSYD